MRKVRRRRTNDCDSGSPIDPAPMKRPRPKRDGPGGDRRHAVTERLAQRAMVMAAPARRRLLRRMIIRRQAGLEQAGLLRSGDAVHHRRQGLHGQRQSEQSYRQPAPGHETPLDNPAKEREREHRSKIRFPPQAAEGARSHLFEARPAQRLHARRKRQLEFEAHAALEQTGIAGVDRSRSRRRKLPIAALDDLAIHQTDLVLDVVRRSDPAAV